MSEKVDFKRALDSYRAKVGEFRLLEVPERQYLMIDGHGDPNTSTNYSDALQALYPVAYKLKFASRAELGRDYVVPPLEGLWWAQDMTAFTSSRDKSQWQWTIMILTPDWVEVGLLEQARQQAGAKNPPTRLADVRLAGLHEGRCVQTLHRGPFDDEGPVLEHLHHVVLPEHGLQLAGTHHEIYLSDPRRTAPEKLRTILRQPVADAAQT